jgi:hypothetical protein
MVGKSGESKISPPAVSSNSWLALRVPMPLDAS